MSFKSARIKAGKKISDVAEHLGVTDGAVYPQKQERLIL